jgi:aspartyl protease family protein
MGHIYVKVKIADETLNKILETQGNVDTKATLTVIPRKIASELGLKTTGSNIVETGAEKIKLDRSRAWLELEGKSEIIPVLISDTMDKVLIGVTTLEILGLQVDPIEGKLKEWTLLMY